MKYLNIYKRIFKLSLNLKMLRFRKLMLKENDEKVSRQIEIVDGALDTLMLMIKKDSKK